MDFWFESGGCLNTIHLAPPKMLPIDVHRKGWQHSAVAKPGSRENAFTGTIIGICIVVHLVTGYNFWLVNLAGNGVVHGRVLDMGTDAARVRQNP